MSIITEGEVSWISRPIDRAPPRQREWLEISIACRRCTFIRESMSERDARKDGWTLIEPFNWWTEPSMYRGLCPACRNHPEDNEMDKWFSTAWRWADSLLRTESS